MTSFAGFHIDDTFQKSYTVILFPDSFFDLETSRVTNCSSHFPVSFQNKHGFVFR